MDVRHEDMTHIDFGIYGNIIDRVMDNFKFKNFNFFQPDYSVRASFIIFSMDIRHDKDIEFLSINRYKLISMATLEYMQFTRKSGFRLWCEGS
jgi:hypothetical protein